MPRRAELPPALAALVDAAFALLRQAPSARIAIARSGGILPPGALPPDVQDAVDAEVRAAREATTVELAFKDVERVLRDAWKQPPGRVLDDLAREPLAVTPTAQVHRGELDGCTVAVKVRRPGVERSVRTDLGLLDALAPALGAAFPRADAGALLRDVREQALDELDFEHEASQQRRVARAVRAVPGVTVPKPWLEHCTSEVLVSELYPGRPLSAGELPHNPGAAARSLIEALRSSALEAGLAPADPRASHVLVGGDDSLGLVGVGVARPVDRERAARALDALGALAAADDATYAAVVEESGVLDAETARDGAGVLRDVLGELVDGPATLDAAALGRLIDRAYGGAPELARLAMAAAPQPQDLVLGRMLGQLVAVLAHLGARDDWPALATRSSGVVS